MLHWVASGLFEKKKKNSNLTIIFSKYGKRVADILSQ
jgi:hypothetical protein